jgi:hypothetical protein
MKQDAQIKRKVSALDMLNSTRHAFKRKTDSDNGTSDDDDEESGETEEDEPPLEVSDYGLEVAFEQVRCGVHTCCKTRACFEVLCVLLIALHLIVQLKKIYTTLSLEEPEEDSDEEKEGNYTRRKVELGVLLNAGGDFLKALGVDEQGRALGKAEKAKAKVKKGAYSDTDSDSDESNASQQSSRSYLQGVDKYRTSKRLCCAVLCCAVASRQTDIDGRVDCFRKAIAERDCETAQQAQGFARSGEAGTVCCHPQCITSLPLTAPACRLCAS